MHRRLVLRLLFAVRLAVAIGCFQLTGYGHLVSDALAAAGVLAPRSDDCDDERDDRPCPPGCPTCHCAHCVAPALPVAPRTSELAPAAIARVSPFEHGRGVPPPPDPSHVFRPPRLPAFA